MLFVLPIGSWAQNNDDSTDDRITVLPRLFGADTGMLSIMGRLEKLSQDISLINAALEKRLDTRSIELGLDDIEDKLAYSQSYFSGYDQNYTYRILRSHFVLLKELAPRFKSYDARLAKFSQELSKTGRRIYGFAADSSFRHIAVDSSVEKLFIAEYNDVMALSIRSDSILRKRVFEIAVIQSRLYKNYIKWSTLYENLKYRLDNFAETLLIARQKPLFSADENDYEVPAADGFLKSYRTAGTVFFYYLKSHWRSVILVTLLCYLAAAWLIFLRKKYKEHVVAYIRRSKVVLNYLSGNPLFASLLLAFSFSPYFFSNPPLIFTELIWTLLGILLTILFFHDKRMNLYSKLLWVLFFVMFRLVAGLNLLLYTSLAERWVLLLLNIAFIVMHLIIFQVNRQQSLFHRRRATVLLVGASLLHLASIGANMMGYFNLAKILSTTATFAIFTAIELRVFVDTTREALTFQLAYLQRNFQDEAVFKKLYTILYHFLNVFAVISWVIILFGSLNIMDWVSDRALLLLNTPMNVGSTSFTAGSVLLFFAVIWISFQLSNIIALITDLTTTQNKKYFNLRNSKLLVKIVIVSSGLILATAASGIPVDRIAIVLGALSVGIGFGLQNLVSNLVAGLIITIEHPVRIGDTIEVGSHIGQVREIGFRSINIYTSNGADIIIPNSDLLSQHVINWTLSSKRRRVELRIPAKYEIDVADAEKIITGILNKHEQILKIPAPEVAVGDMKKQRIELVAYFWCDNPSLVTRVRSEVLQSIFNEFHAKGYLKNMDSIDSFGSEDD